jgi:hypothetical protein
MIGHLWTSHLPTVAFSSFTSAHWSTALRLPIGGLTSLLFCLRNPDQRNSANNDVWKKAFVLCATLAVKEKGNEAEIETASKTTSLSDVFFYLKKLFSYVPSLLFAFLFPLPHMILPPHSSHSLLLLLLSFSLSLSRFLTSFPLVLISELKCEYLVSSGTIIFMNFLTIFLPHVTIFVSRRL